MNITFSKKIKILKFQQADAKDHVLNINCLSMLNITTEQFLLLYRLYIKDKDLYDLLNTDFNKTNPEIINLIKDLCNNGYIENNIEESEFSLSIIRVSAAGKEFIKSILPLINLERLDILNKTTINNMMIKKLTGNKLRD